MAESLLKNQWQIYVGILVETTLTKNQRWFHVFVPEFLPLKTGDVTAENGTTTVSMFNQRTDKTEEITVDLSSTIYAEYFGITTGMDVPTMYRGMQVLVLNRITTDKWYWIPLERDDCFKTFEHQRISCADIAQTNKSDAVRDDTEGRDAGLTDDNTYYMEIDTKYRKHVMISTAASDGEAWRYFFKIDAEQHTVELWDNCVDGSQPNNTIKIESRPDPQTLGKITIQNASGNSIIMQGMDTIVNIPRNLTVNIGGDTLINQVGNVTNNIGMCFTKIIGGNESRTTVGSANRIIQANNVEVVKENQSVTIGKLHEEKQMTRSTTAVTGATLNAPNYSMTSMTATFNIQAWTCLCTTISFTAAKAWSLIARAWTENAQYVAGTVVSLIRGGHH